MLQSDVYVAIHDAVLAAPEGDTVDVYIGDVVAQAERAPTSVAALLLDADGRTDRHFRLLWPTYSALVSEAGVIEGRLRARLRSNKRLKQSVGRLRKWFVSVGVSNRD